MGGKAESDNITKEGSSVRRKDEGDWVRQRMAVLVKVVAIVVASESVWEGNERVSEVSLREWGRSWWGGGLQVSLPCQTNICLSVPLGRHVSAAPDWAPPCTHRGSLPWPIIIPPQEDTGCMITTSTERQYNCKSCKENKLQLTHFPIN